MSHHLFAGAGGPAPAKHHTSHTRLLAPTLLRNRLGDASCLDAIVVSAARPAGNTLCALRLGATLGVTVVLMCSHEARSEEAAANARALGVSCIAIDLPESPQRVLPHLETSTFDEARHGSHGDLSHKRNLALALGKLAGWRTLLFLDDDIRDVDPDQVRSAVAALDHRTAVGMPAVEFPDNSVVCHARRLTWNDQSVFVSGSALAVNLRRVDTFFPQIYNEDWLFLAPHLDRRDVAATGRVRQLAYAPFARPGRAETQEFGDVLAEGLIGYLHSAPLHPLPPVGYWEAFLDARAAFIAQTRAACQDASATDAVSALDLAEEARSKMSAATLASYLQAWAHDLAAWIRFIAGLPRLGNVAGSFRHLGLSAVHVTAPAPSRLRNSGQRTSEPTSQSATLLGVGDDGPAHDFWPKARHQK